MQLLNNVCDTPVSAPRSEKKELLTLQPVRLTMEDKHNVCVCWGWGEARAGSNRKPAWLAVPARCPETRCDGFVICSSEAWPQDIVNEGLGEIGR